MEGRSLKFLCGDLSFFMLIAFYECSLWTVLFFSRRKTHATYTSCTHRLCRLGRLPDHGRQAPGLPVWLEPVLILLLLTHGSLSEASWRPGRDVWRGGWWGTQLSKFSYYQVCQSNQISCSRTFLFAESKILTLREKEKALKGSAGSKWVISIHGFTFLVKVV